MVPIDRPLEKECFISYGTIICDLTTYQPVALLPDRKPETVTTWLKGQGFIEVVSRDGFRAFRQAISQASSTIS